MSPSGSSAFTELACVRGRPSSRPGSGRDRTAGTWRCGWSSAATDRSMTGCRDRRRNCESVTEALADPGQGADEADTIRVIRDPALLNGADNLRPDLAQAQVGTLRMLCTSGFSCASWCTCSYALPSTGRATHSRAVRRLRERDPTWISTVSRSCRRPDRWNVSVRPRGVSRRCSNLVPDVFRSSLRKIATIGASKQPRTPSVQRVVDRNETDASIVRPGAATRRPRPSHLEALQHLLSRGYEAHFSRAAPHCGRTALDRADTSTRRHVRRRRHTSLVSSRAP